MYLHEVVAGASTITDTLQGTPAENAGPRGRVKVAYTSTDQTNTAHVRAGGVDIVPAGSHASSTSNTITTTSFIYNVLVPPGSRILADLVHTGSDTTMLAVHTE